MPLSLLHVSMHKMILSNAFPYPAFDCNIDQFAVARGIHTHRIFSESDSVPEPLLLFVSGVCTNLQAHLSGGCPRVESGA